MKPARSDVTRILQKIRRGEVERAQASEQLLALVYDELHRIAAASMRHERPDHTLQPTALIHEAYLKLVDQELAAWQDRAHFLGVAARAMRQVLVDHARRRSAAKRGGGWHRVTLDESVGLTPGRVLEVIAVDDALQKLGLLDERAARVAELRTFGGLSVKETAEALGVSDRTVDDDWAMARLWLSRELRG